MSSDAAEKPVCEVCESAPASGLSDRDFHHICRECAWHSAKALGALLGTPGIECPPPVHKPRVPRKERDEQ